MSFCTSRMSFGMSWAASQSYLRSQSLPKMFNKSFITWAFDTFTLRAFRIFLQMSAFRMCFGRVTPLSLAYAKSSFLLILHMFMALSLLRFGNRLWLPLFLLRFRIGLEYAPVRVVAPSFSNNFTRARP